MAGQTGEKRGFYAEPGLRVIGRMLASRKAEEVRVVSQVSECPRPGFERELRFCPICREQGGRLFLTDFRAGVRYEFDTRQCMARVDEPGPDLRAASGLTEREAACRLAPVDRWNREAYGRLAGWQPGERGVYLLGRPCPEEDNPHGNGTGKTWGLCALVARLCSEGIGAVFTTTGELLDGMRAAYGQEGRAEALMRRWCEAPALCLDGLGQESIRRDSEWGAATLYAVIDRRVRAGRAVFVSSRLRLPGDVERRYGPEYGPDIASRLVGACDVMPLSGPDRRYGGR